MRSVKSVSAVSGECARERRVWAMCVFEDILVFCAVGCEEIVS